MEMTPELAYWPNADSRKKRGIPVITNINMNGSTNAPENSISDEPKRKTLSVDENPDYYYYNSD